MPKRGPNTEDSVFLSCMFKPPTKVYIFMVFSISQQSPNNPQ